jgi:hypothetical protein
MKFEFEVENSVFTSGNEVVKKLGKDLIPFVEEWAKKNGFDMKDPQFAQFVVGTLLLMASTAPGSKYKLDKTTGNVTSEAGNNTEVAKA